MNFDFDFAEAEREYWDRMNCDGEDQDAVNKTCNMPHVRNCTTCKFVDYEHEKCSTCDRTYSMWEQR